MQVILSSRGWERAGISAIEPRIQRQELPNFAGWSGTNKHSCSNLNSFATNMSHTVRGFQSQPECAVGVKRPLASTTISKSKQRLEN
jgi:hypothetical protein